MQGAGPQWIVDTVPELPSDDASPGGAVVVIGRSWLPAFLCLLLLEALPEGTVLLVIGRPVEATRALTAATLRDFSSRVQFRDHVLGPGDERFVHQLLGGRVVRLVVSASDDPGEQQVARSVAQTLGAAVLGASCGGAGWAGPGVPQFSGSPDQRPAMALRLARSLAMDAAGALTPASEQ